MLVAAVLVGPLGVFWWAFDVGGGGCAWMYSGGGVYRILKLYYNLGLFVYFSKVLCFGDVNL